MQRAVVLNQIKQLITDNLNLPGLKVYLFGSWATNQEQLSSDIDVGIWYKEQLPQGALAKLRFEIEESNIPYNVDLVDLTRCDNRFCEKVMEEGQQWTVSSKE